jgi:hypothetical protein
MSHTSHVSVIDTQGKSYQPQIRNYAIALISIMMPWGAPSMDVCIEWCESLGVLPEQMFTDTGVTDPRGGSRASRARSRDPAKARLTRQKLVVYLKNLERNRDKPTEIGRRVLGIEEWEQHGEFLLYLDEATFFESLATVKQNVAILYKKHEAERARKKAEELAAEAAFASPVPIPRLYAAEPKMPHPSRKPAPPKRSRPRSK